VRGVGHYPGVSVRAGERLCRGFTPEGHCPGPPGARSCSSSCKISAKSDNPRPSYSDLTNKR